MVTLVNRAKVATATTGTGTITLGAAESGYQTFADAGVTDGQVVRYVIEDGTDWEIGTGTYTASGTTLSRTVDESSNSDAALNLSGSAVVYVSAAAEDVFQGELFAENYDGTSTKPSATGTNAVAIGRNATATQDNNISIGINSDATGLLSSSFGIAADSAGGYSTALGYAAGTSSLGSYSLAAGASAQTAGTSAVALVNSYASGNSSFAAAIANNTSSYGATGANSVAIGYLAKASNSDAVALGDTSTASGTNSFAHGRSSIANSADAVAIGIGATSTASRAFSFGDNCIASASYSFSIGRSTKSSYNYSYAFGYNTEATRKGVLVFGGGQFGSLGDAQCGTMVLRRATTDATPTVLTSDGSTPAGINEVQLPNNSAYSFSGTIIARQQASAGSDYAAWEIKGALLRDANAASTVLGNGIKNKMYASAGASAWDIALTADTTNGGLAITVTGAAATNIRWVATVHTSEVTY